MGGEATEAAREAPEAPAESLRARWGPALGALWPDVATGLRAAVIGAAQEADATAVQALGERLRRMLLALTR